MENQLKTLLDFLKEHFNLSQKQVAQFAGIAESSISAKLKGKRSIQNDDMLIKKIEDIFGLVYQTDKYFFLNKDKIQKRIDHFLHGKSVDFFNTYWVVYNNHSKGGIYAFILKITASYLVEITVEHTETIQNTYTGSFYIDKTNSFLIANLQDSLTNTRELTIRLYIGIQGGVPDLVLGHYSVIGNYKYSLLAENIICERYIGENPEELKPKIIAENSPEYLALDESIRRYLYDKTQNTIATTKTCVRTLEDLQEWFSERDKKDRTVFLDTQLKNLVGNYKTFSFGREKSKKNNLTCYSLTLFERFNSIVASLNEDEYWTNGELTCYNNIISIFFRKNEHGIPKHLFMSFSIPMLTQADFFLGFITGISKAGSLVSFGIFLIKEDTVDKLTPEITEKIRLLLANSTQKEEAEMEIVQTIFSFEELK